MTTATQTRPGRLAAALAAALGYVRAGLSVIPVRPDGTKAPALDTWAELRTRLPTELELREWFGPGECGVAVVAGPVSRNLEVLDFDSAAAWAAWSEAVLALRPDALDGVPRVLTPGGGRHLYLFREVAGPSRKLARDPSGKTLIEVRGDGGYVLAPGSPPRCHPRGREYVWEVPLAS